MLMYQSVNFDKFILSVPKTLYHQKRSKGTKFSRFDIWLDISKNEPKRKNTLGQWLQGA